MTRLVAVPNVSEGRDESVLDAIGAAFATHADVLHRSADEDHHRAVFFLAGELAVEEDGNALRADRVGGQQRLGDRRAAVGVLQEHDRRDVERADARVQPGV